MPFYAACLLGFALVLLSCPSFGQQALKRLTVPELSLIREGLPTHQAIARSALEKVQKDERLGQIHTFKERATHLDPFGQLHVRYDQFYRGVRVWDGMAIMHVGSDGQALAPSLSLRRDLKIPVEPNVRQQQAQDTAAADPTVRDFNPNPVRSELVLYPVMGERIGPVRSRPDGKMNAEDVDRYPDYHVLAWHVRMEGLAKEGPISRDFMVDAISGTVIKSWDSLQTAGSIGTGNSEYNGVVTLNTDFVNGVYELRDTTRASAANPYTGATRNETRNMDKSTSGNGTVYSDPDNFWGDGNAYNSGSTTTSANGQTAAVDAAYGLQITWDYYKKVHNWNGIDNLGTAIYNQVHYGSNYANAFWSDSCLCMTYGDGSPSSMNPLTALDVVGHEISHGFTSNTADLVYQDEPGGLNEANSDISAAMVEFYSRGGSGSTIGVVGGNWTIGEQVMINGQPLRYMYKPSKDGISPDEWYPLMGSLNVHYSSGPMNRAFYFLSQGASSISSSDYYTPRLPSGMTGIENDKAARIWFRAMSVYLTPNSYYWDARLASIRAARDLYGSGSAEVAAVKNAFAGINVGAVAAADDTDPTITLYGPDTTSGTMIFNASATDASGIAQVDYYLDGLWWAKVTVAPYTLSLDSTQIVNGDHELRAQARDAAGNVGQSNILAFTSTNLTEQLISNPGIESGSFGWTVSTSGIFQYEASTTNAHSGIYYLKIGGAGTSTTSTATRYAYQSLSLPSAPQTLNVSFWVKITTGETTTTVKNDTLTVRVYNSAGTSMLCRLETTSSSLPVCPTLSNLDVGGYTQKTFDFMAYKGQSIMLVLWSTEDNNALPTTFYVDDISVAATLKDLSPEFSAHPANTTITVGQTAKFNVKVGGFPTPSLQWQKNGVNISGATSSSYTTPSTATYPADNNAKYAVVATNTAGSKTSNAATLTVNIRSRDINSDGVVDILDLASLARAWGATLASSNWNVACDLDGLGATSGIGDTQLNLWLQGW
jgi:Zn-dependent metalloprotease